MAAQNATAKIHLDAQPAWSEPVESSIGGIFESSTTWMLLDDQFNLLGEAPERFTRLAKRAHNITGVKGPLEIRFVFHPSYGTLTLHHVKLQRGS